MHFQSSILAAVGLVSIASAHGVVTSPPPRKAGAAMSAACGAAASAADTSDPTGPIESLTGGATCDVFVCKGLQLQDNIANVQTFTPGQTVNILVDLPIPHEGPCNVSILNPATNTIIGQPLIVFDSYADESLPTLPANNTNFDITMPSDLGTTCAVAGDCVIQWFWLGEAAKQTYESCIDFTMAGGAGGAAAPASVKPAAAVAAPATEKTAAPVVKPANEEATAEKPAAEKPATAKPANVEATAETPADEKPATAKPATENPAVVDSCPAPVTVTVPASTASNPPVVNGAATAKDAGACLA